MTVISRVLRMPTPGSSKVPVSDSGRTYLEGKKITWRDGMAALFHILRYNLFASSTFRPSPEATET